MKTLNQVRDEWIESRFDNTHNKLIEERSWDACLDHISKTAGDERTIYVNRADMDFDLNWRNVLAAEFPRTATIGDSVKFIEHSAYLSKCAQLAKAEDNLKKVIAALKEYQGVKVEASWNNMKDVASIVLSEIGAGK